MSVDQITDQSPPPAAELDRPVEGAETCNASQVVDVQQPQVDVLDSVATDTVEALLLSIARGSPEAFVALQTRMAGLVRVNVRRVLRDGSRCEAVTQETFAEVREDAVNFDPRRHHAQTWLLTRAHQHAIDGLGPGHGTDDPKGHATDHAATDHATTDHAALV